MTVRCRQRPEGHRRPASRGRLLQPTSFFKDVVCAPGRLPFREPELTSRWVRRITPAHPLRRIPVVERACSTRSRRRGSYLGRSLAFPSLEPPKKPSARSGWIGSARAPVKEHKPTPARNAFHRQGSRRTFRGSGTVRPPFPRFCATRSTDATEASPASCVASCRLLQHDTARETGPRASGPRCLFDTGRRGASPTPTVRPARGARLSTLPPAENARASVVAAWNPQGWESPAASGRPRPRLWHPSRKAAPPHETGCVPPVTSSAGGFPAAVAPRPPPRDGERGRRLLDPSPVNAPLGGGHRLAGSDDPGGGGAAPTATGPTAAPHRLLRPRRSRTRVP